MRRDPEPKNEVEVITRGARDLPSEMTMPTVGDSMLAEQIRRQDMEIIRGGLEKAGISRATLDKLRVFDDFAPNAGRFLVASLDMSHKMMMFQNVALMEEAEFIRANYLRNEALDPELRIEWQKCYNEICDILGKGYDRTLNGTQVMAKIVAGKVRNEGPKAKPSFTPLTALTAGKKK